jgi:hypothetical protein
MSRNLPSGVALCIAGSRTAFSGVDSSIITEYVGSAVEQIGLAPADVDVVLSGTARGADAAGEQWAESESIPVDEYPADWEQHGKAAGPRRNETLASLANVVLVFWDGSSTGSASMIRQARDALPDDRVFVDFYREGGRSPSPTPASGDVQLPTPQS